MLDHHCVSVILKFVSNKLKFMSVSRTWMEAVRSSPISLTLFKTHISRYNIFYIKHQRGDSMLDGLDQYDNIENAKIYIHNAINTTKKRIQYIINGLMESSNIKKIEVIHKCEECMLEHPLVAPLCIHENIQTLSLSHVVLDDFFWLALEKSKVHTLEINWSTIYCMKPEKCSFNHIKTLILERCSDDMNCLKEMSFPTLEYLKATRKIELYRTYPNLENLSLPSYSCTCNLKDLRTRFPKLKQHSGLNITTDNESF